MSIYSYTTASTAVFTIFTMCKSQQVHSHKDKFDITQSCVFLNSIPYITIYSSPYMRVTLNSICWSIDRVDIESDK